MLLVAHVSHPLSFSKFISIFPLQQIGRVRWQEGDPRRHSPCFSWVSYYQNSSCTTMISKLSFMQFYSTIRSVQLRSATRIRSYLTMDIGTGTRTFAQRWCGGYILAYGQRFHPFDVALSVCLDFLSSNIASFVDMLYCIVYTDSG